MAKAMQLGTITCMLLVRVIVLSTPAQTGTTSPSTTSNIGGSCVVNDQCTLNNTSCKDGVCSCDGDLYNANGTCRVRPVLNGELEISGVERNIFTVLWFTLSLHDGDRPNVIVTDKYGTSQHCINIGNIGCSVFNLESGSEYFIYFNIIDKYGVPSHPVKMSTYTKPDASPKPTLITRWENNLTLTWNDDQEHNCEYYNISIRPAPNKGNSSLQIPGEEKFSNITFNDLDGGTLYTVTIVAVAGKYKNDSAIEHVYTRPIPLSNATLQGQTSSSLNISVVYGDKIQYRIHIEPRLTSDGVTDVSNCEQNENNRFSVQCANTTPFAVNGLSDGTLYNLTIYAWLQGLESETALSFQNYTRPKGPSELSIKDITSAGFTVTLNGNGNFDFFVVQLCQNNNGNTCLDEINTTANEYVASNLTPGTIYTVIVNTILDNGLESLDEKSISSFTRPNGLIDIDIPVEKVHETNATIDITPPVDGLYDHIVVNLSSNSGMFVKTFKNMTVITDLTAGTKYKVEVFTATITDLTSSENITREFHTRPATPSVGIATERDLDYITFDLTGNTGTFDQFRITYENGTLLANVSRAGDKQFNATGLTAGTGYAYTVFTNYLGLRSDGYFLIRAYTKPEQISDMKITHITNDAINVEWKAPSVGTVSSYMSEIFCLGPNDNSKVKLFNNTSSALIAVATGLEPGSICNASVTTQINDNNTLIHGKTATDTFVNRTTETGPQEIQDLSKTQASSRSIPIEWERPSIRNGVITGYEIHVVQDGNNIHTQNLNCTSCTITNTDNDLRTIAKTCADASFCNNAISDTRFRYNITDLHPFRTYNVSVVANTSLPGITLAETYNTDESVPTGPPLNIQTSTTATAIELTWTPPSYEERNGIITKYNISYTFRKRTCFDDEGVVVTQHVSQKDNSTTRTLSGLDPYTYHDVRIQALTSIGEGPFSDFLNISTKQSKPSVVRELNVTKTTNESIALSWVQPCRPNGEIKKYTIYLTNTDNNINSKRNSTDNHIDIRDDILPYSNYSITVAGNTIIGEGEKTQDVVVRTKVGAPKIPRNIDAKNVSSTTLNITWATPELYTGPTTYTIVVTDYVNQSQQITKQVMGFHAQTAIIDTLDKYWFYNVSVIAETEAGQAESTRNLIRTDEDVPDKVKGLSVIPESDITKPRTIKVKWNLLTAREMNGVLKGYTVSYSIQSGTETNDTFGISSSEFVITGITPGQYTIKVFASTSKGKGMDNSQSTALEAGAPLRINESSANPLIRAASIAVNDETQIAIELPTSSFLCTKSNGEPTEWGVIVSEESVAIDESFFGNKSAYDKRKNSTYKRWFEAKDMNPMPAYIATKPGVYDPCKHIGNRKERSTSGQSDGSFTIGADGKCSGVTGYCNGELPPGRSFRVKAYVCTTGGCTKTKYSQPIRTDSVEPPTEGNVWMFVGGFVGGTVCTGLIAIAVVFFLRRHKKTRGHGSDNHQTHDCNRTDPIQSTDDASYYNIGRSIKRMNYQSNNEAAYNEGCVPEYEMLDRGNRDFTTYSSLQSENNGQAEDKMSGENQTYENLKLRVI